MFLDLIQAAGNRVLKLDPETLRRLGELQGKVVQIELTGPDLNLYLIPGEHGIEILRQWQGEVALKLRGSPLTFTRLLSTGSDPTMFANGEVDAEGDIAVGQRLSHILRQADVDLEEVVSRLVGDIPAHQLGNFVRDAAAWTRHARAKFTRDAAEYLQEEIRQLAPRARVDALLSDIDTLRSDVERLQQRVVRLTGISHDGGSQSDR